MVQTSWCNTKSTLAKKERKYRSFLFNFRILKFFALKKYLRVAEL